MRKLWLYRHGQHDHRINDGPLTPLGQAQTVLAADTILQETPNRALVLQASDDRRVIESADIILNMLDQHGIATEANFSGTHDAARFVAAVIDFLDHDAATSISESAEDVILVGNKRSSTFQQLRKFMQDRLGVGEDLPQPEVGELRGYTVNDSGWLQEFDVEDRQDEAGGLAGMIIQHQITLTPQRRGPTLGLSM